MSSFADCNTCLRRHKRPVNTKCEYGKVAVEKCVSLGLKSSDYMLHLPDLLPEDKDPKMAGIQTKGRSVSVLGQALDNELVAQLLSETLESRKLLESSHYHIYIIITIYLCTDSTALLSSHRGCSKDKIRPTL